MKRIIRNVFRKFGFDIIKADPLSRLRTVHTGNLTLYKTKTGNYYLPTDAGTDEIAGAIRNNKIFDKSVYEIAKQYIKLGKTTV